jgi:hypothetical protein
MTQEFREAMTRPSRPSHRMNLRMTHSARKELDQNLIRRGIGELNFIYDQWLIGFYQNCRSTLNSHAYRLL